MICASAGPCETETTSIFMLRPIHNYFRIFCQRYGHPLLLVKLFRFRYRAEGALRSTAEDTRGMRKSLSDSIYL